MRGWWKASRSWESFGARSRDNIYYTIIICSVCVTNTFRCKGKMPARVLLNGQLLCNITLKIYIFLYLKYFYLHIILGKLLARYRCNNLYRVPTPLHVTFYVVRVFGLLDGYLYDLVPVSVRENKNCNLRHHNVNERDFFILKTRKKKNVILYCIVFDRIFLEIKFKKKTIIFQTIVYKWKPTNSDSSNYEPKRCDIMYIWWYAGYIV